MHHRATLLAFAASTTTLCLALAVASDANVHGESHNLDAAGTPYATPPGYDRHLKRPARHTVLTRFKGNRRACADACDQDPRCTGFVETVANSCELLATGKTFRAMEKKAQVDAAIRSFEAKSKIEQREHDRQLMERIREHEEKAEQNLEEKVGNLDIKNRELLLAIKKAKVEISQERRHNKAKEQQSKKEVALSVAAEQLGEMKAKDDAIKHRETEEIGQDEAKAEKQVVHTGTLGVAKEAMKAQIKMAKRKIKDQKQKGKEVVSAAAKKAQGKDFCKDKKPESFCSEATRRSCRQKCEMEALRAQCAKTCQACDTQDCEDKRDKEFCSEVKAGEVCQESHCASAEFKKYCKRTCGLCGEEAQQLLATARKDAAEANKAVEAEADSEVKDAEGKELAIEQNIDNSETSIRAQERRDANKLLETEGKQIKRREEDKKHKLERMASTEKGQKTLIKEGGMKIPLEEDKPSFALREKMEQLEQREVFTKSKLNRAKQVEKKALEQRVDRLEEKMEARINGDRASEDASVVVHKEEESAKKASAEEEVDPDELADVISHDLAVKIQKEKIQHEKDALHKTTAKEQRFKDQQQLEEYKRDEQAKYDLRLKFQKKKLQAAEEAEEMQMANPMANPMAPQASSPKDVQQREKQRLAAMIRKEEDKDKGKPPRWRPKELPGLPKFIMFQEEERPQGLGHSETQVEALRGLRKLVAEEKRVKTKLKYQSSRSVSQRGGHTKLKPIRHSPPSKRIKNKAAEQRFKQKLASIKTLKAMKDAAAARAVYSRKKANDYVEGDITSADLRRNDVVNIASHYVRNNEHETLLVDRIRTKLQQEEASAKKIELQMYNRPG